MSTVIPTLFIVALAGLVIICGTLLIVASLLRGERSRERRSTDAEETRLFQELNQNLNRLEQRIEAIETILMDSETQKESKR